MNDIEQRIRELPLPGLSEGLDRRVAEVLHFHDLARAERRGALGVGRIGNPSYGVGGQVGNLSYGKGRAWLRVVVGTALAAGVAGFAAGLGMGQWLLGPREEQAIARPEPRDVRASDEAAVNFVQLTDLRVSAGLDFSQPVEPFQVTPVVQEGT